MNAKDEVFDRRNFGMYPKWGTFGQSIQPDQWYECVGIQSLVQGKRFWLLLE